MKVEPFEPLLPCPFCDCEKVRLDCATEERPDLGFVRRTYVVICDGCAAQGPWEKGGPPESPPKMPVVGWNAAARPCKPWAFGERRAVEQK